MAPPRPFRPVYRAFDHILFDPRKSESVFAERGFDLAFTCISRMFPGYVLEREDTRPYRETRYQAIGEILGEVYFVVYTWIGRDCRLVTAWLAAPEERGLWYDFTR